MTSTHPFTVIELETLKTLAFDQIMSSITPQNVLQELASPFTHRYAEVKRAEFAYLRKHWVMSRPSLLRSSLIMLQLEIRKDDQTMKEFIQLFHSDEANEDLDGLLMDVLRI